jgi:hypothetical protein
VNDYFVEQQWPQPRTEDHMRAMREGMAACLGIHRATWCGSLLSLDGCDMFCHFRAPDAESVRIATRPSGAQARRVWACTFQDAPGFQADDLARANVVVAHRFDAPADFGARALSDEVDMGCFKLHRVRLLRSYLAADRLRMVCLYQALDAESVRLAQRHADLPPDRVLAVRRYAP